MFHEGDDLLWVNHIADERVQVITPQLHSDGGGSVKDRVRHLLDDLLADKGISSHIAWYYSPMALKFSDHLEPLLTVYDCMDELSAFKFAPLELRELEQQLFQRADLVFTGGNSLFEAKRMFHNNMYAFPSSIDKDLFRSARTNIEQFLDQALIPHPRLGFYGVLDERLDIELLDELARKRPEWQIILIGPVVKIDRSTLPAHDNIHYLGPKNYLELPAYLAGWDIAIMPFAINESTRYISPTKTPEYLCGGKHVISTPIRDVVNDYGQDGLVEIASNADEFIAAAERILSMTESQTWLKSVDERLANNSWDITWEQMYALMASALIKKTLNERAVVEKYQPI